MNTKNQAKIDFHTTVGTAHLQFAEDLKKIEGETVEAPAETTTTKKTSKKTSKKASKKTTKKADKEARLFFTSKEPPQTAEEMKVFHKQWNEMNADQQEEYLAGNVASNIASLQGKIDASAGKKAKVEEVDELDELEELEEIEEVEEKVYTVDEVRKAAQACAKRIGKPETYAILENFGSKKVAEIDPSDFSELMEELKA